MELRNTSTHFITEEYETVYIPLLQACVFNYAEKINEFHQVDITKLIPENFLTLSVRFTALDETAIRAKYTKQVAEKLISINEEIEPLVETNNSNFAIRLEHFYYSTKDRAEATEYYHIEKEAKEGVRIVKELKNPNLTHKYNAKRCIKELNNRLSRENIRLIYNSSEAQINQYHFQNLVSYFGLKDVFCKPLLEKVAK